MRGGPNIDKPQETLNYWKQLTHVLKYFRSEEDPKSALPKNFIQGFLEVSNRAPDTTPHAVNAMLMLPSSRAGTRAMLSDQVILCT